MADTDLVRSESVNSRLATGYDLGASGAKAATEREWLTRGATNIYSTTADMARFVAALLGGGANDHGSILEPATPATMFEPHYQPDPRLPGMGLGFFRYDAGGHHIVEHDGRLPGFNSQLFAAPKRRGRRHRLDEWGGQSALLVADGTRADAPPPARRPRRNRA